MLDLLGQYREYLGFSKLYLYIKVHVNSINSFIFLNSTMLATDNCIFHTIGNKSHVQFKNFKERGISKTFCIYVGP